MTPIEKSESTALLVLDWQLFFVSPESPAWLPEAASVEGNVYALVESFRTAGREVIATRHGHARGDRGPFLEFYGRLLYEDDPLARLAPFLNNRQGVRVVAKDTYSAFARFDLGGELRAAGIGTLAIAGLQADKCVVANALAAFDLGFKVIVVSDACAARTKERRVAALELLERTCSVLATTHEICGAVSPYAIKGNER
jgi:nicotinamidase-related amidase